MNLKKITSAMLAGAIVLGCIPSKLLANVQKPIQKIETITVGHKNNTAVGQEGTILPVVQADWIPPVDNDQPVVDGTPAPYGGNSPQRETHYDFKISNMADAANTATESDVPVAFVQSSADRYSANLGTYFPTQLKNGALYKLEVTAKHKHSEIRGDEVVIVDSPVTKPVPEGYFITDFDIQALSNDGLTLTWEYIPGVTYKLFYEKGVFDNITKMPDSGVIIKPEDAAGKLSADRTRVEWKVENAVAGQIYSAYVIPIAIDNKSVTFDKIKFNSRTPKIVQAVPKIPLIIDMLPENKIRLSWDIKNSAWVEVDNKLIRTEVYAINKKGEETLIGVIYNVNNGHKDVGYYETTLLEDETEYRVDFYTSANDGTVYKAFSAGPGVAIADTDLLVPFAPSIPDFFPYRPGDTVLPTDIEDAAFKKYKVKFDTSKDKNTTDNNYDDIELTQGNIEEFREHTFHVKAEDGKADLQIVWDMPKSQISEDRDFDLYYDVWISEKADEFTEANKRVSNLKIDVIDTDNIITKSNGDAVGFKTTIEGLSTNKTYYIKMIAKRKYGENHFVSSIPEMKEIVISKDGDAYEPPVIGKPPLQVAGLTQNTIDVKWTTSWFELMAQNEAIANKYQDADEKLYATYGHSKVFIDDSKSPVLRFIDPSEKLTPIELYGADAEKKLARLTQHLGQAAGDYLTKPITLGKDVGYKVKVISQKDALTQAQEQNKTIEQWVADQDISEIKYQWQDITSSLVDVNVNGVEGKQVTLSKDCYLEALNPNTAYIIMVIPYRTIDEEEIYAAFPSFILATTLTDHNPNPEIPKTPRLYNYKATDVRDTDVTVRWIYNENFEYELVYGKTNNPDEATVWEFTEEDKKTFIDGSEAYVTVTGLNPLTGYNFWLRAIQKKESLPEGQEPLSSDWSTPVTVTTKDILAPEPPKGLGLVAYQSLLEIGVDEPTKGSDYITVEWAEDPDSLEEHPNKEYSYVVEFADNVEFIDSIKITTPSGEVTESSRNEYSAEMLATNIVKFTNLEANRPYYIRVKTVLKFTPSGEGKEIIKESSFCELVRILTATSKDEYDSGDNENIVNYPNAVEEDVTNGVWTYDIVDNDTIISNILASNQYLYTINMEKYYNSNRNIHTRIIKMSNKLINALISQRMALEIFTGIGRYEIPYTALKGYASRFNAQDMVEIKFDMNTIYNIAPPANNLVYENAEEMAVTFRGRNTAKYEVVNRFDDYIKVNLKTASFDNAHTYQYVMNAAKWNTFENRIEKGYIGYSAMNTGINAVFMANNSAGNAAHYILDKYNVVGLANRSQLANAVGAKQFVNLMVGLSEGQAQINLHATPNYNKAQASGLYISSSRGNVTIEQAIAATVKLYELQQGQKIRPTSDAQRRFTNVSSTYREAAQKAYTIGIIDQVPNPQRTITYVQLLDLLQEVM